MSAKVAAAVLLIAVPIGFNVAFYELGRAFDYPNILRQEPDEIPRRFAAGGSGSSCGGRRCWSARWRCCPSSRCWRSCSRRLRRSQFPRSFVRWPFAVPELARRYIAAEGPDAAATRGTIKITGTPELVGYNEQNGWPVAGTIVPIAYAFPVPEWP